MNGQRGFIAITTAIIMAAVLLATMMTVSFADFYARFDDLGDIDINVALENLAVASTSQSYMPRDERVPIDSDDECVIQSVAYDGNNASVAAYASEGDSFATITATVSLTEPITIISWRESP
jgi:hypothetical protein